MVIPLIGYIVSIPNRDFDEFKLSEAVFGERKTNVSIPNRDFDEFKLR